MKNDRLFLCANYQLPFIYISYLFIAHDSDIDDVIYEQIM